MPTHPQVSVGGIMIDEEIAELVELLWANGFVTTNSCQHNIGVPIAHVDGKTNSSCRRVWLEMPDESMQEFLQLVTSVEGDELYGIANRAVRHLEPLDSWTDFRVNHAWHFDVHVHAWEERICFDMSVRFPYRDVAELTQILRANLQKEAA